MKHEELIKRLEVSCLGLDAVDPLRLLVNDVVAALRGPEHEPVAWMVWSENNVPALTFTKPADKYVFDALYTHQPQRTWVGLTDEEIVDALQPLYQTRALAELAAELFMDEFQAVVCKFMEKNT